MKNAIKILVLVIAVSMFSSCMLPGYGYGPGYYSGHVHVQGCGHGGYGGHVHGSGCGHGGYGGGHGGHHGGGHHGGGHHGGGHH